MRGRLIKNEEKFQTKNPLFRLTSFWKALFFCLPRNTYKEKIQTKPKQPLTPENSAVFPRGYMSLRKLTLICSGHHPSQVGDHFGAEGLWQVRPRCGGWGWTYERQVGGERGPRGSRGNPSPCHSPAQYTFLWFPHLSKKNFFMWLVSTNRSGQLTPWALESTGEGSNLGSTIS